MNKNNYFIDVLYYAFGLIILNFILSNSLKLDVLKEENIKFQIAFFFLFLLLIKDYKSIKFNLLDLVVLSPLVLLIVHMESSSLNFMLFIGLFSIYFFSKTLFCYLNKSHENVSVFTVLLITIPASLCIIFNLFFYLSLETYSIYGDFTFGFTNPNHLTGYLTINIIIWLSTIKHLARNEYHILAYILIFFCVSGLIIIIFYKSNAALASTLIVSTLILFRTELSQKKYKIVYVSVLILSSIILLSVIDLNSVLGRIRIWEISLNMFSFDDLIIGNGFNTFKVDYSIAQLEYFSKNTDPGIYNLAGYITYAHNEYLQFIYEFGLISVVFLISSVVLLYISNKNMSFNSTDNTFYNVLIGVALLSLFSFPLHIPSNAIIILFLLGMFSSRLNYYKIGYRIVNTRYLKVCVLLLSITYLIFTLNVYSKHKIKHEAVKLSSLGQLEKASKKFKEVEFYFKNDGNFLFHFGSNLLRSKQRNQAKEKLERALNFSSDPNIHLLLGKIYEKLDVDKTEHHYLKAYYTVPNRINALYHLFVYHKKNENAKRAKHFGAMLLKVPQKVNNKASIKIKQEVKEYLR